MAMLRPQVVDLSHYDTTQPGTWGLLVAANYAGVIHKATQGTGLVDISYGQRRSPALKAGLKWGAYHFADSSDPVAQADHFLDVAKPDDATLLALDWEDNKARTMSPKQARAFLDRIMEKTGRTPKGIWIYGGNVLKEKIVSKADIAYFGQFPLWLCQYGAQAQIPKAWSGYTCWQFTGDGNGPKPHTAPGVIIAGGVDNNVVCDGFDFEREWGACRPAAVAAEDAKVGIADLVAVSRKANGTLWFKRAWKGFSVAGVLSGLGMAKDTSDQVGQIIADHWLAILITTTILVILFIKWLEGLMVEDTNEGRYTPSGANAA